MLRPLLIPEKVSPIHHPKKLVHIQATKCDEKYQLNIVKEEEENNSDVAHVYWLPWISGLDPGDGTSGTVFVSMDVLNMSGCEFFLTSTLSGCRFVATEKYLAHISKSREKHEESVIGRDFAEQKLVTKNLPKKRLALSQSNNPNYEFMFMYDSTYYSYQLDGEEGKGFAFVIGIKGQDGEWSFKYLKYADEGFPGKGEWKGTWQTMEFGEAKEMEFEEGAEEL